MVRCPIIAVCGGSRPDAETARLAADVGYELARAGVTLVCGGLGGVMEMACKGAKRAGGTTVGIVPGTDTSRANAYVDVPIASGMSHGRNALITHTADGVIALPGAYGTLSEVALALTMGKPVLTVGSWCPVPGVRAVDSPAEAVAGILEAISRSENSQFRGDHEPS